MTRDTRATVLVTVGTDHHPFDRLSAWADRWAAAHAGSATVFVQHGTSARPRHADGADYLAYDALVERMRHAAAVVTHGGPATIVLARQLGKLPIVVPRERHLREHVDDHQLLFARRLVAEGAIVVAATESELATLLDRALDRADAAQAEADESRLHVADAVRRFEDLVTALLTREERARA